MKRFFLIPLFCLGVLGACDPAGEAKDACQQLLDDTIPPIVQDIEDQCQDAADQAQMQCSEDINAAIDDIQAWAEDRLETALKDAEHEAFTRAGCVEAPTLPLKWDCSASQLCR